MATVMRQNLFADKLLTTCYKLITGNSSSYMEFLNFNHLGYNSFLRKFAV